MPDSLPTERLLDDAWMDGVPLDPDVIGDDFSNLDDLAWLESIAKSRSVVLVGETHYYRVIHNLVARIFFALNHFDRYDLISVELPYSSTPYWDYYVGLADDPIAAHFYQQAIVGLEYTREQRLLLEHIRRWNRAHPARRLHISGHDVEHGYTGVIKKILNPYFTKLDPFYRVDPHSLDDKGLLSACRKFQKWLLEARKVKLVGAYPFVDSNYIDRVVTNLVSTARAFTARAIQRDFDRYRQKAIIRNLTHIDYLGRFFLQDKKVLIYGGINHMQTHGRAQDEPDCDREGLYFGTKFRPTRGKTYSLLIDGTAYSLGDAGNIDLSHLGRTGNHAFLRRLQKAYRLEGLAPNTSVLFSKPDEWDALVFRKGMAANHRPIHLLTMAWAPMLNAATVAGAKDLIAKIHNLRKSYEGFDDVVIVPSSPITIPLD